VKTAPVECYEPHGLGKTIRGGRLREVTQCRKRTVSMGAARKVHHPHRLGKTIRHGGLREVIQYRRRAVPVECCEPRRLGKKFALGVYVRSPANEGGRRMGWARR
jgi:hypothetical protein